MASDNALRLADRVLSKAVTVSTVSSGMTVAVATREVIADAIDAAVTELQESLRLTQAALAEAKAENERLQLLECVDPGAPWVRCNNCGKPVKTCERKEPIGNSYMCPLHPDGSELTDGRWACSAECWEVLAEDKP